MHFLVRKRWIFHSVDCACAIYCRQIWSLLNDFQRMCWSGEWVLFVCSSFRHDTINKVDKCFKMQLLKECHSQLDIFIFHIQKYGKFKICFCQFHNYNFLRMPFGGWLGFVQKFLCKVQAANGFYHELITSSDVIQFYFVFFSLPECQLPIYWRKWNGIKVQKKMRMKEK